LRKRKKVIEVGQKKTKESADDNENENGHYNDENGDDNGNGNTNGNNTIDFIGFYSSK